MSTGSFDEVVVTDGEGRLIGRGKNVTITENYSETEPVVQHVQLPWWARPEFQRGGATNNPPKVRNKARGSTQSRKDKAAHRARVLYAKDTRPVVVGGAYINREIELADNAARRAWGAGISGSKGLGATGRKLMRGEYRSFNA